MRNITPKILLLLKIVKIAQAFRDLRVRFYDPPPV